jgi:hypothetical protein
LIVLHVFQCTFLQVSAITSCLSHRLTEWCGTWARFVYISQRLAALVVCLAVDVLRRLSVSWHCQQQPSCEGCGVQHVHGVVSRLQPIGLGSWGVGEAKEAKTGLAVEGVSEISTREVNQLLNRYCAGLLVSECSARICRPDGGHGAAAMN